MDLVLFRGVSMLIPEAELFVVEWLAKVESLNDDIDDEAETINKGVKVFLRTHF